MCVHRSNPLYTQYSAAETTSPVAESGSRCDVVSQQHVGDTGSNLASVRLTSLRTHASTSSTLASHRSGDYLTSKFVKQLIRSTERSPTALAEALTTHRIVTKLTTRQAGLSGIARNPQISFGVVFLFYVFSGPASDRVKILRRGHRRRTLYPRLSNLPLHISPLILVSQRRPKWTSLIRCYELLQGPTFLLSDHVLSDPNTCYVYELWTGPTWAVFSVSNRMENAPSPRPGDAANARGTQPGTALAGGRASRSSKCGGDG